MQMARRALALLVVLLGGVAAAGTKIIQNDTFTGGSVNAGIGFAEYEGAAVIFEAAAADYPLKIIAVDALCVPYMATGTNVGAYVIQLWDERGGTLGEPWPTPNDGGTTYRGLLADEGVQLTTSLTQFNRFTLPQPITVTSGKVMVRLSQQTQSSLDNTTLAMDLSATPKPGANFYFQSGWFTQLDRPDGGFFNGLHGNWVIRLVLEVPDVAVTVTSIAPNSTPVNVSRTVVITGTNFELGAKAFLGTTELTVTSLTSQSIGAIVPAGLAVGRYDVRVRNLSGVEGVLPNGFEVLQVDGGSGGGGGTGGGAGTGGGSATGGGTGTGGGSGTGGGGTSTDPLTLVSVTPAEVFVEDTTSLFLTGTGFETGARVLIGGTRLQDALVESSAVISATLSAGTLPAGTYEVTVINLSGEQATLPMSLKVLAGSRVKPGCSCAAPGLSPLLLLGLALVSRRRARGGRAAA